MNWERHKPIWIFGLAVALLVGSGLVLKQCWHRVQPNEARPATPNPSIADVARRESLARLCVESGGELWKRAVFVEPSRWLPLGRCPTPPEGAKTVWESQPEYGRHFEACMGAGTRSAARVAQCATEIAPFCAGGVLHNSSRQSTFALVHVSRNSRHQSEWQIEDSELTASWETVSWNSNIWTVSNTGEHTQVDVCTRDGMFYPESMASNPGAPQKPYVSGRSSDSPTKVTLLAEFGKLVQWDCFGAPLTLRDVSYDLANIGCKRSREIEHDSEVTIHLSAFERCRDTHSMLEWRRTTVTCEGNELLLWIPDGKVPLRPNWWSSVAH